MIPPRWLRNYRRMGCHTRWWTGKRVTAADWNFDIRDQVSP